MGDPCHAWDATCELVEWLSPYATPVIVTKHWMLATDEQFHRLITCGAVLNTSMSALDSPAQLTHRQRQFMRYRKLGGDSVARIVSCEFNTGDPLGAKMDAIQRRLFTLSPVIDNPLRVTGAHPLAQAGVIRLKVVRYLTAMRTVSVAHESTYVDHCDGCPDQCGISSMKHSNTRPAAPQGELFASSTRE